MTDMPYTPEDVIMLAAYVLLALVCSFLCSVAEAVLLSITPSYIEALGERNPKHAARLRKLKNDKLNQSLSAILTLNTIAHTVGAIGAGAKATVVFGNAWFGLFSAIMTLMILFLSEIVPKTIGAVYWSILEVPTARFVQSLIVILYPVVWISEKLTAFISRRKVVNNSSRDELIAMASLGVKTGQLHSKESRIIENLLRFETLKPSDIMTPRTVIFALPEDMKIRDAWPIISRKPFSRIPIYTDSVDSITGFILKDDVLIHSTQDYVAPGIQGPKKNNERSIPLSAEYPRNGNSFLSTGEVLNVLKREILTVPESISVTSLFEQSLKNRHHIAVIVNEHGGTEGLVTLEDLIESIIGMEIVDETDRVEDMRILARKRWVKRAKKMGIKDSSI
ncbi:hemolysin [Desulfobacter hydrogenophilus]|uniref:Hemolysin n=2 Tax=Desulfobacter hydrogenophilus TaxID=2291 RepID=A0A328FE86_9BACT|nr:HlyC/CorC family transporter [Desulfobacter hydrogenophilus]QBH14850.1 HlyC/CorC family transporter [Desulfobacter hydrogenophilus]RAM01357.1 hemolysin [Desulfobacter hydrogenophilus]